jgi:hypothetical protein
MSRPSIEARLAKTAGLLLRAVGETWLPDQRLVREAWVALPGAVRPARTWPAIRDVFVDEWPNAHPLLGL